MKPISVIDRKRERIVLRVEAHITDDLRNTIKAY